MLDKSGKTTIFYRLKRGEVVTTIPTKGFNLEGLKLQEGYIATIWDVGLRDKTWALVKHYLPNTAALVFVIDSSDAERMEAAADFLKYLLNDEPLFRTLP
mmetsp:Transcript_20129/g.25951  ORF Transcript_20129/g.25951 Transcript_20129/m.25951 type:complete len:100 (-) Transcript_20129:41-340(-)